MVYLDDILIYTKDPGQLYVDAIQWFLKQLQKYGLYTNLKKCRSYEDKIQFLGFVVLAQGIRMEENKIEAIKDWLESQSVKNIQVFLSFANFYRKFIKNFSRIAAPLISMLWTINESIEDEIQSTQAENQDAPDTTGGVDDGKVGRNIKNLSTTAKSAKSKKPKLTKPKKSDLIKAKNLQRSTLSEWIFLLPKLKKPSYTYKRPLLRLQFLGILIQMLYPNWD